MLGGMVSVSLLGIPHDENSSFMRGAAEAPPLIRRELVNDDAYSTWSETGVDLGVEGRVVDHGDIHFDGTADRGIWSKVMWGRPWSLAIH